MNRLALCMILGLASIGAIAPRVEAAPEDDQWAVAAGHYKQQRWGLAVDEFQRLRKEYPQARRFRDAVFFEAEALAQLDKHADAAARFREYLQMAPQGPFAKQALFRAGEAHYLAGQLTTSREDLERFRREHEFDPLESHGLLYLGEIALAEKRGADAGALFQEALRRFPDAPVHEDHLWGLARACEQQNQADAALAVYRQLIDQQPAAKSLPQALFAAARWHDKLQQDNEAAAVYERLDKEFPRFGERDSALYQWAWVERDRQRPDDSEKLFQRVHDEHKPSRWWADATFRLAERAVQGKQFERADMLLRELLAAKPAGNLSEHALYLHGQMALAQAQWDDARGRFEQLVRDFPNGDLRVPAEYWRAEIAYRQGRYDDAGELFGRLVERTTEKHDAWRSMIALRRAQVFAQQKRWSEARDIAARFARDFPRSSQQHEADYLLGRCHASQGEFETARQAYRRVIASESAGKSETAAMAQWMIGESHFHQKDFETAIKEYLRVEILYAFPTWQAGALLQAGKCHEALGQTKLAAELYDRLLKTYPDTTFQDEATKRQAAVRQRLAQAAAGDGA